MPATETNNNVGMDATAAEVVDLSSPIKKSTTTSPSWGVGSSALIGTVRSEKKSVVSSTYVSEVVTQDVLYSRVVSIGRDAKVDVLSLPRI